MTEPSPNPPRRFSPALVVPLLVWFFGPVVAVCIAFSDGSKWDEATATASQVRADSVSLLLGATTLVFAPLVGLIVALRRRRKIAAVLYGVALALSVGLIIASGATPSGVVETVRQLITGYRPPSEAA